jgi:hypothetical protein
MKNKFSIIILTLVLFISSCETEKLAPELSVSVNPSQIESIVSDTIVVKVNQPIEFQLSGNPDIITFFSGENAHAYINKDRLKAVGTPKLDFNYNSKSVTSAHKVDVLMSTDFSGHYDSISIRTAKWDTLTPPDMKAYLNTAVPKAISTIDLSKYAATPAFLAYRLVINSTARFSQPSFSGLLVRNYLSDGSFSAVVEGFNALGMSFVTLSENGAWKSNYGGVILGNSTWKLNANSIQISTQPIQGLTTDMFYANDGRLHEIWAISKVLYLDATMPDTGISAKNMFEPVSNYKYTYTKTGVYTVTFVGSTTDKSGVVGTTVKELIVKVI